MAVQTYPRRDVKPAAPKPGKSTQFPGRLASGAVPIDPFEMSLVISIAEQIVRNNWANANQQILVELRDLYRFKDPEKLVSACWRLFSLYKLIQSGALAEWVSPDSVQKHLPMPVSVVFVAATLPLKDKSGFAAQEFLIAVRECSRNDLKESKSADFSLDNQ